jgi:hypothetical protein
MTPRACGLVALATLGLGLGGCNQPGGEGAQATGEAPPPPAVEQVWFLCDAGPAAGLVLALRDGEGVRLSVRERGEAAFGAPRRLGVGAAIRSGDSQTTELQENGLVVGSIVALAAPSLLTGLAGAAATKLTLDGDTRSCWGDARTLATAVSADARWRLFEDPLGGIVLERWPIGAAAPAERLEQGVRENGKDSLTVLFGAEASRSVLYAPFAGPASIRRWRDGVLVEEIVLQALALAPPRALGAEAAENET